MKKIISFALTVSLALCMASCSKAVETPKGLDKNFVCKAKIIQDNTQYKAKLKRIDGAGWSAVFSSPETIDGMEVSLLNDRCTVKFKDLTYTGNRKDLPQNGMIEMIAGAIDKCIAGKGITTSQSGNETIEKGVFKGTDFTAHISGKKVSKIEISTEISAEISDYKAK